MPGTDRRRGLRATRLLLAGGLLISAGIVAVVGGWWGLAIGAGQAAAGVAVLLRPDAPGPLAGAMIVLVPAPLMAARHWTARLPGGCNCAQLAHPPGLLSVTGVAVALDLLLLGLTVRLAAIQRQEEVGKSSR